MVIERHDVAGKPIQEQLGARVIESLAEFARADLSTPAQLQANEFAHVADAGLRRSLAEVFYGVRWIYKLGLGLLTRDEERAAHIRAQLVDYGSVVEGLLSYCIAHAIRHGHQVGTTYRWKDPDRQQRPIAWNAANPDPTIAKQQFWWLVRIGKDFQIVSVKLSRDQDWLRKQRNTVHLRQRSSVGRTAFLNQSKAAYKIVMATIRETKAWCATHP